MLVFTVSYAGNSFASKYNASSFFLKNKMQVIVITNSKVPVVSHMVWYKVGAIDEEYGKSGVAHFLEHIMFKGTEQYPIGEFSRNVYLAGGEDNAFTGSYFTSYFQNISLDGLELVMKMEADRMQNLTFDEKEFEVEKKVIKEERYSRVNREPVNILSEQMKSALFLNHPKGRPVIGWDHEINSHTIDDIKSFYEKYYTPSNAILIVSGDITEEKLRPLAEKYYGNIPAAPEIVRKSVFLEEPNHVANIDVSYKDQRVKQERLKRYYLAPSQTSENEEYAYALIILSELLGSGQTSLLYQKLVKEDGVASFVSSNYSDVDLGETIFSLSIVPSPGHTIEDAENSLDVFLSELTSKIKKKEVERIKTFLIDSNVYSKEDLKHMAYIFGEVLTSGLNISYIENWEDDIKRVTAEDVIEAAKFLFSNASYVTGKLLPEKDLTLKESSK